MDNASASIKLGPASRVESHEAIVCGNLRARGIGSEPETPGAAPSRRDPARMRVIQFGRSGRSSSANTGEGGVTLSLLIEALRLQILELSPFSISKSAAPLSGLGLNVVLKLSGGELPPHELVDLFPFSELDHRWPA